jgi:hypothetical protein
MAHFGTFGLAAIAASVLMAGAAQADVLVVDDFESYGATSQTNFTGFTSGLTVTDGTVDFVHEPEFGLSTPYGVGMIDLDGSTSNSGVLSTSLYAVSTGQRVSLSFDASGNQRGGDDANFRWAFGTPGGLQYNDVSYSAGGDLIAAGSAFTTGYSVTKFTQAANDPWRHYSFQFTAGSNGMVRAFIDVGSNDNVGPLIDNFSFSIVTPAAVPEPAAWALMIAGFGLSGAALRRRRALAA